LFKPGSRREPTEPVRSHGRAAPFRGGRQAVEVIALGTEALGKVAGTPLLFESMLEDRSACRLPMLEMVGGPVDGGLVQGDLLV
jgi:hypothetical protein